MIEKSEHLFATQILDVETVCYVARSLARWLASQRSVARSVAELSIDFLPELDWTAFFFL